MADQITAIEIVGEIRKGVRQFEVYKEAERVAQFILSAEQYKNQLDKETKETQTVLDKLQSKLDEYDKKLDALVAAVKQAQVDADIVSKTAEEVRTAILTKARTEAEAIVRAAKQDQEFVVDQTKELQQAKKQAQTEAEEAKDALASIKEEIKAHQERVSKMFG